MATDVQEMVTDAGVRSVDARALMQDGVVARVRIQRWRPYAGLDEADLGLPAMDDEEKRRVRRVIDLGRKLLVTPEWERRVHKDEEAIRGVLERNSFNIGGARFIPARSYLRWKAEHAAAVQRLLETRDAMVAAWDEIGETLRAEFARAADVAYRNASAVSGEVAAMGPVAFREEYVGRVMALRPGPEAVAQSFSVTVELDYLDSSAAPAGPVAEQPGTAREMMAADVAADVARRREALAEGFLRDVLAQIGEMVYQAAGDVLGSLARNGRLTGSSARQLENLARQEPLLTFADDPEMAAIVGQVKRIVDTPAEAREAGEIARVLRAVAVLARRQLIDLGRDVDSLRELGVPDRPSEAAVREARDLLLPASAQMTLDQAEMGELDPGAIVAPDLEQEDRDLG